VTGDRVQVLDSDLAPGEMPRRPFSEATAASPEAGSRYLVKRDETLWQIASRARPEGVSVQQAMLDIQRLNPEAFIDGNINQIKAGYIIYLPSAADISSDDLADALAEVQAQNRAWQSGRGRTPGVTAAATLRISADDGAAATPAPADGGSAAAAGSSRDGETVAATDGVPAAEAAAPAVPSAPAADSAPEPAVPSATDGAMAGELAAQLAAMAERLDALEATVSVKDQEIARLEAALREARESAEAAAADAAAARARAVAPPQTASPSPATSAAGGFMPWVYGIAGAAVLALLAVLGLRRARGGATPARAEPAPARPVAPAAAPTPAASEDDVFAGVTLREDAMEAAPEPDEPPRRDVAERGYGERRYDDYIDDADGGDALAEADIYIAYGRYLQAAELLTTAIRSEPGNSAFRLKLLELYADMGEGEKAREQLEALREQGDPEAIARGERIVGGAAPAAPAAKAAAEPEPEPEPEPVLEPEPEPVLEPEPLVQAAADAGAGELAASEEDEEAALGAFDGLHIEEEPPGAVAGEALDLELEEPLRDPVEAAEAVDFGAPALEVDGQGSSADAGSEGDEELVFAEEGDQMATRLDLARAYLDMGDQDGARSILEEVARSGNAEQQQEANTLLARLG
jgi:pilus assembly protein FimV